MEKSPEKDFSILSEAGEPDFPGHPLLFFKNIPMSEGYKNKNTNKYFFLTGVLAILGVFVFSLNAFAATGINKQISFQGKVVNANGTNVTNGNYDFVFTLYSQQAPGGSAVWTETWNSGTSQVTVTDGVFQVNLGTHTAFPGSVDFNTDNLYLGVTFHTDAEMTPRIRFTAVPYAFNADKIHGLSVTDTTGTLTIANGKTISFSDAFSTTGAFSVTMAASGITSVTLPTSGTLATLAGTEELTNKTIGSTGLVFSGSATDITTATGESLVIVANGVGTVDIQDATTVDSLTTDTGGVSIASGQSYTGTGAVTFSSGGSSGLTIDSASGVTTIAVGDYLALSHSGTSGASAGYIWYDSSDNKFKINENGSTKVLCNTSDAGCGTGGTTTLQTAYDATSGNTILTTTGRDIAFTLGEVATPTSLTVENQDTAGVSAERIFNSIASGTLTNGLLVEQTGAGTMTNAIQILETAGTITTGITIGNNITTGISIGTGVTTGISIASGGITSTGEILFTNTGSGVSLRVNDEAGDTTPFVVDASGNVGIGTSAPARAMDIFQSASAPQLRLSKDLTYYSEFTVDSVGDLKLATVGGDISALSENVWVCDNDACPALTLTGEGNIFVENVLKFGNGVYIKNDSATELGVYDNDDNAMLVFDEL